MPFASRFLRPLVGGCALVTLCTLLASAESHADTPQRSTVKGQYLQNATYLSHNYVEYPRFVADVPALADRLHNVEHVDTWFTNAGFLTSAGRIDQASSQLAQVVPYLNAVGAYEAKNGVSFHVFAWLNGDSGIEAGSHKLDVTDPAVRGAIVDECRKLVSTGAPGSYVTGASRAFDGIMIDIEPTGNDDTYFNALKALMDEIKSATGTLTGFAAPAYGSGSIWSWGPIYYYYMARHVDVLSAMAYDVHLPTGTDYQNWIAAQTTDILRAVSGEFWLDGSHPAPTDGVTVLMGLPAFPASKNHDPAVETVAYAAQGIDAAVTALVNAGDPAQRYFQGTAMYLHTNGSGGDGYATWDGDWGAFRSYWLGVGCWPHPNERLR